MNVASRDLQTLFDAGALGHLPDGQVLERFVVGREESAFGELVRRYGAMVWGVCRRVLFDHHDAEDAFQATFLVLATKAATVHPPDRVANWLYGVASQVALRVRASTARRRGRERQVETMPEPKVSRSDDGDELLPLLDEEIRRLPDHYRAPIVLCELEGKTHGEAARLLGWPVGTVSGRLSRARKMLSQRLARRGRTLSAGSLAVLLSRNGEAAPAALVESTVKAAAGQATHGLVSAKVLGLAKEAVKLMLISKLKSAAPALLVLAALGCACGLLLGGQVDEPKKDQAPAARRPAAKAPAADPALPKTYTHPISITGRAVDPEGRPVAGAHVYLASQRPTYKRIAEGRADADGRYAFRNVPLPIQRADANAVGGRDEGGFQVFGQADGLGFAWRPVKWFYPRPKPGSITYERDQFDPPSRYEAGDPIVLDLHFAPAARLAGTFADDRGKPLADVRLEIRDCELLQIVDNNVGGWTLNALNERDTVPAAIKIRTTDANGRFDFTDLPANCRFRIEVRAKGFPSQWIHAATTKEPQAPHDSAPVFTGDFKVTLATPVDVPIKMIFADTGKPAPKVAVQAVRGLVSVLETSDDQGRATLRLPPGTYRMENWPARGTPYLVTKDELVVTANPPAEPFVVSLRPAAVVDITVVNAATGAGIPNVDVWHQTGANGRSEPLVITSWEVATRIAWQERPRTNAEGKVRAIVEPGRRRIGVGLQSFPPGYFAVEGRGLEVDCRAGEVSTVTFTLQARP